ncbi:MAG: bacteriohemerythrin [Gallionella sp.]|nr:bacteriohemerythrin [Gallionella sp.]
MGLSDWSPRYSVNHPVMDEHHHSLFKLIDRLSEAIMEKKENELIGETLNMLIDYTKMHFVAEEHLMRQANYPGHPQHKEAHDKLVAQVQDYQRRFQGCDSSVTAEIAQFLMTDWLVKHILGMDELYAPYFKKAFSGAAAQNA